jgi:hypothetical protein
LVLRQRRGLLLLLLMLLLLLLLKFYPMGNLVACERDAVDSNVHGG